jgi:hypothetical protein
MHVELFCLCDSSSLQPGATMVRADIGPVAYLRGGQFHLRGIHSELTVASFPMVVTGLVLAVRLRFALREQGEHDLRIALTWPGGETADDLATTRIGTFANGDHPFAWISTALPLRVLALVGPGIYNFQLLVDGELVASLPISVTRAEADPGVI